MDRVMFPNSPLCACVCGGGVWAREISTICPFGVFPQFCSTFLAQFGRNPCSEASCGVVTFSLVLKAFQVFWGLGTPNSPFVLFGPENGVFELPKRYVSRGKLPLLKRKCNKTGEKTSKDKWFQFHAWGVSRLGQSFYISRALSLSLFLCVWVCVCVCVSLSLSLSQSPFFAYSLFVPV